MEMELDNRKRKFEDSFSEEASTDAEVSTPAAKKSNRFHCPLNGCTATKGFVKTSKVYFQHVISEHPNGYDGEWLKSLFQEGSKRASTLSISAGAETISDKDADSSLDTSQPPEAAEVTPAPSKSRKSPTSSTKQSTRLKCPHCVMLFNKQQRLQAHVTSKHPEEAAAASNGAQLSNPHEIDQLDSSESTPAEQESSAENVSLAEPAQETLTSELDTKALPAKVEAESVPTEITTEAVQAEITTEAEIKTEAVKVEIKTEPTPEAEMNPEAEPMPAEQELNGLTEADSATVSPVSGSTKSDKQPCEICHNSYRRGKRLANHMASKHPEFLKESGLPEPDLAPTIFPCQFCEKHYSKNPDMYAHVSKVHHEEAVQEGWQECVLCKGILPNETVLKYHNRVKHMRKSNKKDVSGFLEVSIAEGGEMPLFGAKEDNSDSLQQDQPEQREVKEEEEPDKSLAEEKSSSDLDLSETANSGTKMDLSSDQKVPDKLRAREDVQMDDVGDDSDNVEEISLDDESSDEDESSSASKVAHNTVQMINNSTLVATEPSGKSQPRKKLTHPLEAKLGSEYYHNGEFSSGDYYETDDAIIMKVDYSKDKYFPEMGPYRCEICHLIFDTNRKFYSHVMSCHFEEADTAAIEIMQKLIAQS